MRKARSARAALALGRVIDETRAFFHCLRLAAEQLHAADRLPACERAVLVELATQGPRTVPEMARARPVSQQHIQTLVNALLRRALVTLAENPPHQLFKARRADAQGEDAGEDGQEPRREGARKARSSTRPDGV